MTLIKPNNLTSSSLQTIQGIVERITFHSEETGFSVLRIKTQDQRELITVVGYLSSITVGESIECRGEWVQDKKHGLQLKAEFINILLPTNLHGMEKYLGSGIVKGIGPHFAKKMIETFGDSIFDVIEKQPERLKELSGLGEKRRSLIVSAWGEQKNVRDIIVFLQAHGVGSARALRIYKHYGEQAISRIQKNPYQLAVDIDGIGFKTADGLAMHLGIPKNSMYRAEAGIHHVLSDLCSHGHCAAEYEKLVTTCTKLLDIETSIIEEALQKEIIAKNLVLSTISEVPCIFPNTLYRAELSAAKQLLRLQAGKCPWESFDPIQSIAWVEKKTGLELSQSQKHSIGQLFKHKLSIITGGPGVGKTTLVNSILKILRANQLSVALCAPTGRAAKRLTETTGLIAKTIHRLLEFDPRNFSFQRNADNPLPIDVLVVDETSMLDVTLLFHLLRSLPDHTALIFVGDVDQLPSVGSGAVLFDMIHSGVIPTLKLTEIFRQAVNSKIILNAHRINEGQMPLENQQHESDFYSIYTETPQLIHDQLIQLVSQRIPEFMHCDPIRDIQVLTPMNYGSLGCKALNEALQKTLNPRAESTITKFGVTYAPGDKIIQTVNNYEKEVFNGDIGYIAEIDSENNVVKINFDTRIIKYDFSDLDEISLAYAITIHKSQGSEFPVVVIPLSTQHYALLAKNLLYTAVTRGKKLVVLIAQKKAVGMAVRNDRESNRLTKLAEHLHALAQEYIAV